MRVEREESRRAPSGGSAIELHEQASQALGLAAAGAWDDDFRAYLRRSCRGLRPTVRGKNRVLSPWRSSKASEKHQDLVEELIAEVEGYLPEFDPELITHAFRFAERAHAGQQRRSGETSSRTRSAWRRSVPSFASTNRRSSPRCSRRRRRHRRRTGGAAGGVRGRRRAARGRRHKELTRVTSRAASTLRRRTTARWSSRWRRTSASS